MSGFKPFDSIFIYRFKITICNLTVFFRGEKIDTFSYAFEGEMIQLLHNKTGFPEGLRSYANIQRQFFESFVGQTFKAGFLSDERHLRKTYGFIKFRFI